MPAALTTTRLYRDHGADRTAVVAVEPSFSHPGLVMVTVARGANRKNLIATLFGPFSPERAAEHANLAIANLRASGFEDPGSIALRDLQNPAPRQRALAALRLGWRRDLRAIEPLLELAAAAGPETATVVEVLGALGDPRAIPLARQEAQRKLLSRRRAGSEALRALGDTEGLAEVAKRAHERLGSPLQAALLAALAQGLEEGILEALVATPARDQGLALDGLYELIGIEGGADQQLQGAVHTALSQLDLGRPHLWRYAKSIWKRAMARGDHSTFALLALAIERLDRSAQPQRTALKSGLDGVTRDTVVFSRRTRLYAGRRSWRYLRRLARWRPEQYAAVAAEVLVRYRKHDETVPRGDFGSYARCHLLHRLLWGGGTRYEFLRATLRHRRRPGSSNSLSPGTREEAFPALWDLAPRAYLRVLATAELPVVLSWAQEAVASRHPDLLTQASAAELAALLGSVHPPAVEMAAAEVARRFDPTDPDLDLVSRLLADGRITIRQLGLGLLESIDPASWALDPQRAFSLLTLPFADLAAVLLERARTALATCEPALRRALADGLLQRLRQVGATVGARPDLQWVSLLLANELVHEVVALEGFAALVADLGDVDADVREVEALDGTTLVAGAEPVPALQAVAAAALAARGDAVDRLGVPRLLRLAHHPLAPVRAAAITLLGNALDRFREDPWPLVALAETDWADTRAGAVALLRQLPLGQLSFDAVFEIVDSSRIELQQLGCELLVAGREHHNLADTLQRLLEHPSPGLRRFTLDLAAAQLAQPMADDVALGFFRAVLMDLSPRRDLKRKAIAVLLARGLANHESAVQVVAILADQLASCTRRDHDEALATLAELALAHPGLDLPVRLIAGNSAPREIPP